MSTVLHWILTIVLFIISLSLLIVIHELGHLSMAKLFNVYCQEFSIGFGPKLLKKRKEGKETYFSIRAIPLGGYVSMYGEDIELEEGVVIPKERSLDGIAKWKKAIILVAGVTLNAVLALTLFAVSNLCFKTNYSTAQVALSETSPLKEQGINEDDLMYVYGPGDGQLVTKNLVDAKYEKDGVTYQDRFFVIDDDVTYNDSSYVLCYYPNSNKGAAKFNESIFLFQGTHDEYIINTSFAGWPELKNYPEYRENYLTPIDNTVFVTHLKFIQGNSIKDTELTIKTVEAKKGYAWEDIGLSLKVEPRWRPFKDRVKDTFSDFGNSSILVFKGLASLFTKSGIKNMSGIVGILNMSSSVLNRFTFDYYIYLWGLISVNLAIFNLLPFPGLDGWALLVTGIEGSVNSIKRRKYKKANASMEGYEEFKLPAKVKNIVSFIGLALLMLLMIAIIVLDILRWVGMV
ncbi:MAG: site-2 protease family protein [Bacilli bacterium]|nr:site-2 protease family protein [Bacilli bacterium]